MAVLWPLLPEFLYVSLYVPFSFLSDPWVGGTVEDKAGAERRGAGTQLAFPLTHHKISGEMELYTAACRL